MGFNNKILGEKFRKIERISSKKEIEELFTQGKRKGNTPIRIYYLIKETNSEDLRNKILIGVPKRQLKRAYQRNLIKRRIREVYRKNKSKIIDSWKLSSQNILFLGIVYNTDRILSYKDIENALFKMLGILN